MWSGELAPGDHGAIEVFEAGVLAGAFARRTPTPWWSRAGAGWKGWAPNPEVAIRTILDLWQAGRKSLVAK